jgi:hypothetical protein
MQQLLILLMTILKVHHKIGNIDLWKVVQAG